MSLKNVSVLDKRSRSQILRIWGSSQSCEDETSGERKVVIPNFDIFFKFSRILFGSTKLDLTLRTHGHLNLNLAPPSSQIKIHFDDFPNFIKTQPTKPTKPRRISRGMAAILLSRTTTIRSPLYLCFGVIQTCLKRL